jgi:hypothetical protein
MVAGCGFFKERTADAWARAMRLDPIARYVAFRATLPAQPGLRRAVLVLGACAKRHPMAI